MRTEAAELAVASVASKSTWAGALVGFVGWLTSNQGVGLIGVLVAVGGLMINWHYKRENGKRLRAEDARRQREHDLRIRERELRIDLMLKTGIPLPERKDTDFATLGEDD